MAYIYNEKIPEDYKPSLKTGEIFDLDFRKKKGLENLFSEGLFLKDTDGDFLPDKLDLKMEMPKNADGFVVAAACNLAFRFGMETTGINGSLLDGDSDNVLRFTGEGKEPAVRLLDGKTVEIDGSGKELFDFVCQLCSVFPQNGTLSWRDILLTMTDDLAFRTPDGQLAYLRGKTNGEGELFHLPGIEENQKARFPKARFINHREGKAVYSNTYNFTWERDDFTELFEGVLKMLKKGDILTLHGAVSEDKKVRNKMLESIIERTESVGAYARDCRILCAYKQGFSWIEEYIIPHLECRDIAEVTVGFKPFLPEGEREWHDEDGATPSYNNTLSDDGSRWYDLPIRYLQELYPIEDVLVQRLGIPRESVKFTVYDGSDTYCVTVIDRDGTQESYKYSAKMSERPYIDDFKGLGKVHPSTGYLKAEINGVTVLDKTVKTDLEKVWSVYQNEVLPRCRRYIEDRYTDVLPGCQPFFQRLNIDVSLSEPDYRVGFREDMISSLDALHEDMYFVGGDYFKNYGLEKCRVMFDAPGLILPVIHNKEGAPEMTVTLYEQLCDKPLLVHNGEVKAFLRKRDDISVYISRLMPREDYIFVEIKTSGVENGVLKAYAELLSEGAIELSHTIDSCYLISFVGEDGCIFEAHLVRFPRKKCKKITDIDLCESKLIGYEQYINIMDSLKEVDGIEVFKTASSYMGRSVYAVLLNRTFDGYVSRVKKLTRCPSLLINARHHANEVSSTNAAFMLLKRLLTDKKYEGLSEKLNLVIVPLENTDGAALHYELQKEHPNWKFHVARFNAVGKEFYHEYFKADTPYSEAMGMTRLYEKFLPDILVDNHGAPSHEWEQQFSGYTSPSYKGFWLLRSLLYGYFWYVTDEEYSENYLLNKKMEDIIADKIAEDSTMCALNDTWSRLLKKYAHSYMPKLFPADYYKGMIDYWIPFAYDPGHRYASVRFPWLTSVAYTSEAADETAQDEYLKLCAKAHADHDEATIDMMISAKSYYESFFDKKSFSAGYKRYRPLTFK